MINSLLPALPYASEAAWIFREAAECSSSTRAMTLIHALNEERLRSHFDRAMWAATPRLLNVGNPSREKVPKADREPGRMPGVAEIRRVFESDGWRCRWCTTPVISIKAIKAMAREGWFPHGRNNSACHGLTLCCAASIDHVVPHSFGGTNELDNLITACWPCQFGRGECLIESLDMNDPRQRPPIVDDWDGCAWFR